MVQQLLVLSQDRSKVYLNPIGYRPADHAQLKVDDILAILRLYKVGQYYISRTFVSDVLEGLHQQRFTHDSAPMMIAERRDALLSIQIDDEGMTAYASITGAFGGRQLVERQIRQALIDAGVEFGISDTQLNALVARGEVLKPGETISDIVAIGNTVKQGKDAQFVALVQDATERILRPRERDDGSVDMRDLGDFIMVKEGQPLMRRHPPTKGLHGKNLFGKIINARDGKDKPLKSSLGSVISLNDSNVLVAEFSGVPHIKRDTVEVDKALVIPAVDVSCGHVVYDGSVIVSGDVCQGMQVKATGSVTVGGVVELANIDAGRDVVITNGIIGRSSDISACCITAQGKIVAKFAQYAQLTAYHDIELQLHASHCHIVTHANLTVRDAMKRKGMINGGIIETGYAVSAVVLGSEASTTTQLSAFSRYMHLKRQSTKLNAEKKEQIAVMERINNAILKIEKVASADKDHERLNKLANAKHSTLQRLEKLNLAIEQLERSIHTHSGQSQITALKCVFAGVTCSIADETITIREQRGPTRLEYDGSAIIANAL
ncbi:DUF342 domain-containing protein [Thaumasiovibrio sp. DFM-14]|uniref:DUF342 domain-containing protein n=1 Tax=Thaumasiovibrio sp. DFM-14 TaxID=3384792 RepID=UPI0039A09B68